MVGTRSAFLLLREAFYGTTRFDDFAERVGISQPVAAARLRELVADGLLGARAVPRTRAAHQDAIPADREGRRALPGAGGADAVGRPVAGPTRPAGSNCAIGIAVRRRRRAALRGRPPRCPQATWTWCVASDAATPTMPMGRLRRSSRRARSRWLRPAPCRPPGTAHRARGRPLPSVYGQTSSTGRETVKCDPKVCPSSGGVFQKRHMLHGPILLAPRRGPGRGRPRRAGGG